jgi:hypothetical protein
VVILGALLWGKGSEVFLTGTKNSSSLAILLTLPPDGAGSQDRAYGTLLEKAVEGAFCGDSRDKLNPYFDIRSEIEYNEYMYSRGE